MLPERLAHRVFERTPRILRRRVQRLWYLPQDAWDRLTGRRDPLLPPRGYRFDGAAAFERVGEEMLGFFRQYADLEPTDRVVDLGCGIGRIAIPLTRYLDQEATYRGLDVNAQDIAWCTDHISRAHPNFEFQHADVASREYNPRGSVEARHYELPFPDASCDFVCAISLFTHLTELDAAQYAREIARILVPGGRCFLTFFLMTEESRRRVAAGQTRLSFTHSLGHSYCHDPNNPEAAIAYDQEKVLSTLTHLGLEPQPPIYGYWATPSGPPTYQDLVIATRTGSS